MVRPAVVDAVYPAWMRARKMMSSPRSFWRLFVVCFIAACVMPSMDLPERWTAWLNPDLAGPQVPLHGLTMSPALTYGGGTIGGVAMVAFLVVAVLAYWRLPFMFFDSVLERRTRLRDLWSDNGGLALQWFLFSLCCGFTLAAISVIAHVAFPGQHKILETGLGAHPVTATAIAMCYGLFQWVAQDFIVPILALEGGTVFDAADQAWQMLKPAARQVAEYLALKAALVFVGMLVLRVVWSPVSLLVWRPLATWWVSTLAGQAQNGVIELSVTVVVLGLIALAVAAVLAILLSVLHGAMGMFFGCFAMYFYAERYPALREALNATPGGSGPDGWRSGWGGGVSLGLHEEHIGGDS